MGHALVGALSYRLPSARMWTPGKAEPVLLVDAVVASIQGLESAGHEAIQLGATRVAGLVVAVLGDDEAVASFGPVMSLTANLGLAA